MGDRRVRSDNQVHVLEPGCGVIEGGEFAAQVHDFRTAWPTGDFGPWRTFLEAVEAAIWNCREIAKIA